MKKIFLVILPALLFIACKSEPVKTETRVYELTFVDGNAYEGIDHSFGGYYFYLISSSKTYEQVDAIIRYKRIK